MANYALLPIPSFRPDPEDVGLPDLRDALSSRTRQVDRYAIDNLELLNLVVDTLTNLPWRIVIDHCHESGGQLHLAAVAQDLGRELDVGDHVNAGVYIRNSETAPAETLVCVRPFRVSCENGALVECEAERTIAVNAGQAPPKDWKNRIQTVIQRSFSGEGIDEDLARFRATTQQMLLVPYELLCHLQAQGLIDEVEQSEIQTAFEEAADFTMYGFINAVTQVAHGLRSDDRWARAFHFERLGGEILRGDHDLPAFDPAYSV
jgi:hypothetical protein